VAPRGRPFARPGNAGVPPASRGRGGCGWALHHLARLGPNASRHRTAGAGQARCPWSTHALRATLSVVYAVGVDEYEYENDGARRRSTHRPRSSPSAIRATWERGRPPRLARCGGCGWGLHHLARLGPNASRHRTAGAGQAPCPRSTHALRSTLSVVYAVRVEEYEYEYDGARTRSTHALRSSPSAIRARRVDRGRPARLARRGGCASRVHHLARPMPHRHPPPDRWRRAGTMPAVHARAAGDAVGCLRGGGGREGVRVRVRERWGENEAHARAAIVAAGYSRDLGTRASRPPRAARRVWLGSSPPRATWPEREPPPDRWRRAGTMPAVHARAAGDAVGCLRGGGGRVRVRVRVRERERRGEKAVHAPAAIVAVGRSRDLGPRASRPPRLARRVWLGTRVGGSSTSTSTTRGAECESEHEHEYEGAGRVRVRERRGGPSASTSA